MTTIRTVDEYINSFPSQVRDILEEMRQTIKKLVPEAEETIRYGIPTYRLKGNLVHFGAYKKHIGFYPTPGVIEAFRKELRTYQGSKGTVQFPLNQPIPYDLVKRMVKFRVGQIKN
jgi:uncharacterized protein YdhG (YjbR/CyaY superfamily)